MIKLFNTLSRSIESFVSLEDKHVGMYTCGPTVYDFAHIGNFRTYVLSDLLLRTLRFNSYDVTFVMNLTDVGHLTGDNLGDADTGEDRMEKSAKKEGKSAWDIAQFYTDAFIRDFERLNLLKPKLFAKATDHIQEQIDLISRLEEKGYTYTISDGVYFDTAKFPDYGKLSNLDQIKEGARVEINPEKKNPRDFALWKFSPSAGSEQVHEKRQMEWESPWGLGFPGWHIECSAMSMKYLGESFDIHVGGIDLSSTHHPNEIAQAEAATGKQFVKYWVHGAFILIDGKRMSKSLGNNYKLQDVVDRGFDPLALRYLYLQTHYRQEMNFTWESLQAAQNALMRLREDVINLGEPSASLDSFIKQFTDQINDDLNFSKALAVVYDMLKSNSSNAEKAATFKKMDEVLGLELFTQQKDEIPENVLTFVATRQKLRDEKEFAQADEMRKKIEEMGYMLKDEKDGTTTIRKIKS